MARRFPHGKDLFELIDRTPISDLREFLAAHDHEDVRATAETAAAAANDAERRAGLREAVGALRPDVAGTVARDAARALKLAETGTHEVLQHVASECLRAAELTAFDAAPDALGRSVRCLVRWPRVFDDAEAYLHLRRYRDAGKLHSAYEIEVASAETEFRAEDVEEKMADAVTTALGLRGRCAVTHLPAPPVEGEPEAHVFIVRHPGSLDSVADLRDDGERRTIYFRPANEATLLFTPALRRMEVCADSIWVRQTIAETFAGDVLGLDLSASPVSMKTYSLFRFLEGMALPVEPVPGYEIEKAVVVEIDVRPNDPRHKVSLKVTRDDDIDEVAARLFGDGNPFRRAAAVARVVIVVRYSQTGDDRLRTLNVTLSDPNRCNLNSNRDPEARRLGYELLSCWGVMKRFEPPKPDDEAALFPHMLALMDLGEDVVRGRWLRSRGLDADRLVEAGFLVRKGRDDDVLIDDDEREYDVSVVPSMNPGTVRVEMDRGGHPFEAPRRDFEKFEISQAWLRERVVKRLAATLDESEPARIDDDLWRLGVVIVDGTSVPVMLARRLHDRRVRERLDELLRARHGEGVGLLLSAGDAPTRYLGPNVIVALGDHVSAAGGAPVLDLEGLAGSYKAHRAPARRGVDVHLEERTDGGGTLHVPEQPPLNLEGAKQVMIARRLVEAHHRGEPFVRTRDLLKGTKATAPSHAFRNWSSIEDVYIERIPPKGKWRLAWPKIASG